MGRRIGGNRQKTLFRRGCAGGEFIRPKRRHSTKTLLFLFVALTLGRTVAKSGIRSNLTGSRDLMEQLAPRKRKNAKAPRNVFVGSLTMEMDR
jgi:hypothetical protein